MKKLIVFLLLCLGANMSFSQVLIYTKNGEGYVHDNIPASVEALKKICAQNNLTVRVSEDPALFTDENLQNYKTIIFSNSNNKAFDTQAQRDAFVNYIHNGGGYVGIHSACASERQWPWYWAMVGGKFVRHPKMQPFDIKVINHDHPSTFFLKNTWAWEDECYYLDTFGLDITVLLAADLNTIEDDKKDEYPGTAFGHYIPLAWYHEFEGGRQFYTALGHKIEHYSDPVFLKHLEGGILWSLKK